MSKFKIGDAVMMKNVEKTYHKCMGTVVAIEDDRYRVGGVWGYTVPILVPEEDLVPVTKDLAQAQALKIAINSVYGADPQCVAYAKKDVECIRNLYSAQRKCKGRDDILVPKIKNVILNDPAVIVLWEDGTKTVVKAQGEKFDPEKGLAMAISKKAFGNKHSYYGVFLKNIPGLKKKGAK